MLSAIILPKTKLLFIPTIHSLMFLVACTQLYKPLCWLVGVSVGLSVRRWMLGARDLWQSALLALGWLGVNLRAPFWACCVCGVGVGIGLALVLSKAVNGTLPINCFVLLLQQFWRDSWILRRMSNMLRKCVTTFLNLLLPKNKKVWAQNFPWMVLSRDQSGDFL